MPHPLSLLVSNGFMILLHSPPLRFYFVGDEDLLEIIGNSKNVTKLQKHFKKMFAGIASLILNEDDTKVIGISSREGEQVSFAHIISASPRAHLTLYPYLPHFSPPSTPHFIPLSPTLLTTIHHAHLTLYPYLPHFSPPSTPHFIPLSPTLLTTIHHAHLTLYPYLPHFSPSSTMHTSLYTPPFITLLHNDITSVLCAVINLQVRLESLMTAKLPNEDKTLGCV